MDREPSEIEKLTARIEKDPRSKLFVPLAEEYKKRGDREMAVHVLTEGLKHNPGYITAKAFLGRLLLEGGDLAGAKKEFEAVVKTIPDNLLAQRKLGDICALQGDDAGALRHYRAVLALNSSDEETASLIADLEAGKSVKDRLAGVIQATPPAEANPAAASGPGKVPAPGGKHDTRLSQAASLRDEEPEEVLVVEPLEEDEAGAGIAPAGFGFLYEPAGAAAAPSLPHDEPLLSADTVTGGEGAMEEPGAAAPIESHFEPAPRPVRTSDALTTNTLAELYIAQGFYDKAAEIYQRMLDDEPNNRALQAKVAELRGLAGQPAGEAPESGPPAVEAFGAVPDAVAPSPGPDASPFGESVGREYVPPAAGAPFGGVTDEQALFGEVPHAAPDQGSTGGDVFSAVRWEPAAASPQAEPMPFEAGFSPGEYGMSHPPAADRPSEPGTASVARRKETIARLEQWLQNIAKEKGR